MTNQDQRWTAVREAITAAMADLPETQSELVKRMGISETKFRALAKGTPDNYRPATLAKVSDALWGRPDHLRRILDGEIVDSGGPSVADVEAGVEAALRADRRLDATSVRLLLNTYKKFAGS